LPEEEKILAQAQEFSNSALSLSHSILSRNIETGHPYITVVKKFQAMTLLEVKSRRKATVQADEGQMVKQCLISNRLRKCC
jgi:hypothetical protein